ncbi:MAG TPA: hypothetical protein VMZ53_02395 [Kofleriaceae bacterium]|nr:hypothetical protein [Kofleriaceae bacterium]
MPQRIFALAFSSVLLVVTVAACKKADKPAPTADKQVTAAPAGGSAAAAAPTPAEGAGDSDSSSPDYTKPALTEAKIQGYIKSMKDGHNPFDVIGAAAGMMNGKTSIANAQAIVDEQEAVAKKYGFASSEDYMDTAGRIMLGEVTLGAAGSMEQVRQMMVQSIADYEKQLADPALPAETKASLSEALADSKKSLAEMDASAKSGDQLNAADLELIKKFKTEIEAAEKANAEIQNAKHK